MHLTAAANKFLCHLDMAGHIKAAQEFVKGGGKIDGVTSIGVDVPLSVASLAQYLGLPHNKIEAAQLSIDKFAMKQCLQQAGLPIPAFRLITDLADLQDFMAQYGKIIVKPVDSRGARGISLLVAKSGDGALQTAMMHALSHSPSKRIMAESFETGMQFSTEGMLVDGQPYPIICVERNYDRLEEFAPAIIEDGGHYPCAIAEDTEQSIETLALNGALAMGAWNSVVKADMVLTPSGPKIIEIALRASGGYLASHQIGLATGVDFIDALCRLACGLPIEAQSLIPKRKQAYAIRYFFPNKINGGQAMTKIEGLNAWLAHKDVEFIKIQPQIQAISNKIDNHTQRLGCVLVKGKSVTHAIQLAQTIVQSVKFTK